MLNYTKPVVITYSTEELEKLFQPSNACTGAGTTYTGGSGSSGNTCNSGVTFETQ